MPDLTIEHFWYCASNETFRQEVGKYVVRRTMMVLFRRDLEKDRMDIIALIPLLWLAAGMLFPFLLLFLVDTVVTTVLYSRSEEPLKMITNIDLPLPSEEDKQKLHQEILLGIDWLLNTEQPKEALVSHHGLGRTVGNYTVGFCPAGWEEYPVIVLSGKFLPESIREHWRRKDGIVNFPVGPLVQTVEAAIVASGQRVRKRWNGAGSADEIGLDSGSWSLVQPAHETLRRITTDVKKCPDHPNKPLCSWDGCPFYANGVKLLVVPDEWKEGTDK